MLARPGHPARTGGCRPAPALADGRELVLPRYTQPEPEQRLVLEKLGWELPPQPPPRIRSAQVAAAAKR